MSKMPPVRPLPDVSMNPTTPTTPQAAFAPAAQQAQAPARGRFITFEGIDGAGKSSQIAAVVALLQASGVDVDQTREPGGTALGERLRELLLHEPMHLETEAMLIFAARREHLAARIEPALAAGRWVVCDRFSDATFAYAADYLKYVAIGSPFIVSSVMLGNLVRGEGAARVSMIGSIIGQVVNIVLDPIFILNKGDKLFGLAMPFGTGQGVAGAAIATVIGNVVSVVFFLIYFLRGKSILSISPGRYRVRGGIARGVITVGLPAAINSLLMSISNMLINVFLQAYGDNAVAAMGITMKANMLVVMLQLGLAQGVQPLVGYCYGANKLDRMRHSIRFSCVCNIVLGTVITVIYFIFTRQVVSVFNDDPAVIDYGVKMLRALMISGPVIGCMFVLNFSFQGMGKGAQSMILSLSRQGLIYFPLLIIMNKTVGLDGIIWSQAVADLVCTVMSVVMFLLVVRKLRRQHSQKTKA